MPKKTLNPQQLKAIKHGSGPLLIIAGAGTGKTTVITERIKWLITKKRVPPSEILALTFTEKAAAEMQDRIDVALPYGYSQMWVMTFHSFCDRILRDEGLHLGLSTDYQLMTETDATALVENHLFDFQLDYYRPLGNPHKFISAILQHVSRLQDEDVSVGEYIKFAQQVKDADEKKRYLELSQFYSDYEKLKISENKLDFGNLISQCLKLFRTRTEVLTKYQQKFKYLLIDEFQDTNYAQNQLINLLAGNDRNLTVVADDDQAIYRWRGAAVSNVIQFRHVYTSAKIIVLTKNYRSTQTILDSAYKLIQNNNPDRLEVKEKIKKRLTSTRKVAGNKVEFHRFENSETESEFIADQINQLHTDRPYKDFAVLVRANAHSDPLIRVFNRKNIPFQFLGPGKLFQRPEVRDLIAYLGVLNNFEDHASFYRILCMDYLGFPPRDLISLLNLSKKNNLSLFESAENCLKNNSPFISPTGVEKLSNIVGLIHKHFDSMRKLSAGQILYDFLQSSGLLKKLSEYSNTEDETVAQNIMLFFNRLKEFESRNPDTSVYSALRWIELAQKIGDSPAASQSDWNQNDAVNILTIHSAKGLEFPVVFLVNLVNGRFPTTEKHEPIPIPDTLIKEILPEGDFHLQEERRLFYVGMTRAKDLLILTAADYYGEGKRLRKISPFVAESVGKDIMNHESPVINQLSLLDWKPAPSLLTPKSLHLTPMVVDYLSYSQIQTFLDCPLHYKAKYLLKIPSPPSAASSFGNTIHKTLNEFYKLHLASQKPDILKIFAQCWSPEGYENAKHARLYYQRGEKYLTQYISSEFNPKLLPIKLEHPFIVPLERLKIGGKIDRVDRTSDGKIEIIDYKTSTKMLTEKEAVEDLQLSFYALAATTLREYPFPVKPENLKLSLYYFEDQKRVSTTRTQEQLQEAKKKIYEYQGQISQSDFKCSRSQICRHCDYAALCDLAD